MPDTRKHISIIEQNYKTIEHLARPDVSRYIEWSTTIIFYMALHYVHAFLSEKNNEHPSNHDALQTKIMENRQLKPIYCKYRDLQDDSEEARYLGRQLSIYDIRREVLKWFNEIQDHIVPLLRIDYATKHDLYKLFPLKKN